MRGWTKFGGVIASCLGTGLLTASCGPGAAGQGAAGQDSVAPLCQAAPDATPPKALGVPRSSFGVSAAVKEAVLLDRLSQEVPTTVAKAKNQSIGAAGRVTYTITRSPFELSTTKEAIILSTHLKGDIEVCKPIGPFCPDYGKCKPSWDVAITLGTNFEGGPELQARTKVELSKGCVLQPVGFNATSELEKITRDEARKVRDRINGELSRINQRIEREWQRFARPQKWSGGCVQWHTDSARYVPPVSKDGILSAEFQVEGWLDRACSLEDRDDEETTIPFPKLDAVSSLDPKIDVTTETPWALQAVQSALSDALKRPVELAISGGGTDAASPNRLWIKQGTESCPKWVQLTPRIAAGKLSFEPLGSEGSIDADLRTLRLALPAPHSELSENLKNTDRERTKLERAAEDNGFGATLVFTPDEPVRVGEDGLLLGARVHGTAVVHP